MNTTEQCNTLLNSLQHATKQAMNTTEQSATHYWTVCNTPQSRPWTPLNSLQHTTEQSATRHKVDHEHHFNSLQHDTR